MFDLSNPQKRERFLIIVAGFALILAAITLIPGQITQINKKKAERDGLLVRIEEHQRHARNQEAIQSRLSTMEGQALAFGDVEAVTRYQNWLLDLATSAGIRSTGGFSNNSGRKEGIYTKTVFTITGQGQLNQIAEFLRRFHRTEYLHMIQSVQPRPAGNNQPGMFNVTFKIEVLSLPQVRIINVPTLESVPPITADERQMLNDIRTRAILSAYTPPPRVSEPGNGGSGTTPPTPPTPPPFYDVPYCFLTAAVEADGEPQCWIHNRVTGRTYYLFEGGTVTLANRRCTIKKIDVSTQSICVSIEGINTLYVLKVGKNFDEVEEAKPAAAPTIETPKDTVPAPEPAADAPQEAKPDSEPVAE